MNKYILFIFLFDISFSIQNNIIQYNNPYLLEIPLDSSNYEYMIFEEEKENIKINLIGRLTKEGDKIKSNNYLVINNKEELEVKFDNIGSFYTVNNKIIICPRGKYHPIEYYNNNLNEIIPLNFEENGNWDLKCNMNGEDKFEIFYLMNRKYSIYTYVNNQFILDEKNSIFEELFDFKIIKVNNEFSESIFFICLNKGYIKLFQINSQMNINKSITNAKTFSQAYFDNDENKLYFITYNNILDFISGYADLDNIDDLNLVNISINDKSPFKLDDNIEIKEINFILNNKYIYYKIYNKNNGTFSFGVMDIILNKIIFNLDENISNVKQYSKDSIIIINSNSAYKISFKEEKSKLNNDYSLIGLADTDCYELCKTCSGKSTNVNNQKCTSCIDGFVLKGVNCTCESGKEKVSKTCVKCGNTCNSYQINTCKCYSCPSGYYLNSISFCEKCSSNCKTCSGSATTCTGCDSNKYLYENQCFDCATDCTIKDEDDCKCELCKNKFERVNYQCKECNNSSTCLHYENNKCNCETCNSGYYLIDGNCKDCDNNCQTCQNTATKCTSCKDNYFLRDNKCYECTECDKKEENSCKCLSCKDGKYLENDQCKNCSIPCKTCDTEPNKCSSCLDGYYFDHYQCHSCYDRCKTCNSGEIDENNQNCQSCKDEYVLNNTNCLNECPTNYYEVNKKCYLCNQLCKTRGVHCNNCTSCIDGAYFLENEMTCKKCNENCKTCNTEAIGDNQNCLSCDTNSNNKYFVNATGFGNNCVSSCPSGTILDNHSTCILDTKKIEVNKALIIAASILGGIVVIALTIFIVTYIKKRRNRLDPSMNEKVDDKLIKEINEDLNLYKSFT